MLSGRVCLSTVAHILQIANIVRQGENKLKSVS